MSNIACVRVFVPIVTVGSCTSAGAATAKSRSITTGGTGASSTGTFGVGGGRGGRASRELAAHSRKRSARRGEETEGRRPRQPLLREPQVHELLDFPGDFAQVHQADHAAAALQRMEAAARSEEHT